MASIAQTSRESLRAHLEMLGVRRGHNVIVHSSLFAFGLISVEDVFIALQDAVGHGGTIAVPTYTFSLTSDDVYSRSDSPCEVGELGNYVLRLQDAIRSRCPIHNHAAVGKLAHLLGETAPTVSIGPGSDFDVFLNNDFRLLLLGIDFNHAATYLHHVEATFEVPYRKWIPLKRRILVDGNPEQIVCNYFGRSEGCPDSNFNVVIGALGDKVETAHAPYGLSYGVQIRDLHDCALGMLDGDPYALVNKNR